MTPSSKVKKKKKKVNAASAKTSAVNGWYYEMCGHTTQAVERYLNLANKSI